MLLLPISIISLLTDYMSHKYAGKKRKYKFSCFLLLNLNVYINFVFRILGFYKIVPLIPYWTFTLRTLVYWLKVLIHLIELWYIPQIKNIHGGSQKSILFWRLTPPLRVSRMYGIALHHSSLNTYNLTFSISLNPISCTFKSYWQSNYFSSNPLSYQVMISSLPVDCKGLVIDLLASVLFLPIYCQ